MFGFINYDLNYKINENYFFLLCFKKLKKIRKFIYIVNFKLLAGSNFLIFFNVN